MTYPASAARSDRVLVVTATAAERDAVLADLGATQLLAVGPYEGLRALTGVGEVVVLAGGVGPAAAAAATTAGLLVLPEVDLVVSMGVAGGFAQAGVAVGDAVVATRVVAADLGAADGNAFLPLEQLVVGTPSVLDLPPQHSVLLEERLTAAGLPTTAGPVLTVSTVTGSARRADELWRAHTAVGEAMEGYGVALAAVRHRVPVLEVRTVSNLVGPRDRDAWDLPGALWALTAAAAALSADPLPRVGVPA